ncbi:MAG: calcium/proton exchanger [Nitrospirae bacterium]|nr:calcium/proton exchanger [Nitrospirota bacterium]MBU6481834.1 calcium/proton exchanger [Nitrospirota bacterium]MDE3040655.1 calcium/proton exchanger [Nitrospirota bacterium]MDE3218385.1 calcium/proton exchanger [Nitrospirota bacterium]
MRYLFTSWLDFLLVFAPVTIALEVLRADPLMVFVAAGLAIIPLAGLLGRATEHLTTHVGAGIGALLNASLGNAAELIIALVALREGLHDVVKASLTGSILGNILLVLGISMFAGGMKYERQKFNQTAAGMGASLLLLAAVGLIIPALFHFTAADRGVAIERELSLTIALVLFAMYIASLLFSLKTHRHLFAGEGHDVSDLGEQPWTRGASIIVLTIATCLVALMSEMLVGAMEPAAHRLGLTQVFVGVILVALVGNAAEHSTAVMVALKNKMDLAYGIAVGSSLQIALLVAPLLVFASYLFGTPLDLIFTPFEVAAVTISVLIVGFVAMDGESHWMEGMMLVGVYLMLAIAFFFLPA